MSRENILAEERAGESYFLGALEAQSQSERDSAAI